jgi:hypothetical protein
MTDEPPTHHVDFDIRKFVGSLCPKATLGAEPQQREMCEIYNDLKSHRNMSGFLDWALSKCHALLETKPCTTSHDWTSVLGVKAGLHGILLSRMYRRHCVELLGGEPSSLQFKCMARMVQALMKRLVDQKVDVLVANQLASITQRPLRNREDFSKPMQAKIRHLGGACVAKALYRVQQLAPTAATFGEKRILQQLVVSEAVITNTTQFPESLRETESLQCTTRGLTNINDKTFVFFVDLFSHTEQLVNEDYLNIYEDKLFSMAKAYLNEDDMLLVMWMDLFTCPDNTSEDIFVSHLMDLYYKITLHFLKIFFTEMVTLFKESFSSSKKAKTSKKPIPDSSVQDGFPCGLCSAECVDRPDRIEEESIACDGICGGRWFHYHCVGITGKEPFLSRTNSKWLCPTCETKGKGRGKGRGKGKGRGRRN